jgi:hypothetical protein
MIPSILVSRYHELLTELMLLPNRLLCGPGFYMYVQLGQILSLQMGWDSDQRDDSGYM